MSLLPPLLVVVGPTASGKTDLAIELCERQNGEIVSADSVQVYRHFDLGSGKSSPHERARVTQHLIDILEPDEAFDAASWAEAARARIADIGSRGRLPVVCGGTFLWIRALLYGLSPMPAASETHRTRHRALVAAQGRAALHAELASVDPESARRLSANDFVRVSRALEVYERSGMPISQWHAQHGFRTPLFAARLVGLERSREELDQRIDSRVRRMLELGLEDEVRALLSRGFGPTRAMGSVGYKQVAQAFSGALPRDRTALHAAIVRATRIFARRQRTWLRDQPVSWVRTAAEIFKNLSPC